MSRSLARLLSLAIATTALVPSLAHACACGCGLFDVGTSSMYPDGAGGMVFAEYDLLDQNHNRAGDKRASPDDNADKRIQSHFVRVGGQYLFNRDWGVQAEVPYWSRTFQTTDQNGNLADFDTHAVGDIRVSGIYTGASEDMSTGLTFGVKLANGQTDAAGFDSDTQIGSGSTDLLLGAYHLFKISSDGIWNGFAQVNLDQPVVSKAGYVPGSEIDSAVGAYYAGWEIGKTRVSPILAVDFASRGSDAGTAAHPEDTGYRRILAAPGFEVDFGRIRLYGDVQIPVYGYFNGNQLAAPISYKIAARYVF
jgi:hypothetical protein